jgi:hypothetical protein
LYERLGLESWNSYIKKFQKAPKSPKNFQKAQKDQEKFQKVPRFQTLMKEEISSCHLHGSAQNIKAHKLQLGQPARFPMWKAFFVPIALMTYWEIERYVCQFYA